MQVITATPLFFSRAEEWREVQREIFHDRFDDNADNASSSIKYSSNGGCNLVAVS